jgi:hypothetical protein
MSIHSSYVTLYTRKFRKRARGTRMVFNKVLKKYFRWIRWDSQNLYSFYKQLSVTTLIK